MPWLNDEPNPSPWRAASFLIQCIGVKVEAAKLLPDPASKVVADRADRAIADFFDWCGNDLLWWYVWQWLHGHEPRPPLPCEWIHKLVTELEERSRVLPEGQRAALADVIGQGQLRARQLEGARKEA